jgi:hypothetical protein
VRKRNQSPFKKGFRKVSDKKHTGHPAYIYKREGDEYKFIGITHAEITQGTKNIPLEVNPDPNDNRTSYIKPKTDKANKSAFRKRLDKWRFSPNDDKTVKMVIDENEKKGKPKK